MDISYWFKWVVVLPIRFFRYLTSSLGLGDLFYTTIIFIPVSFILVFSRMISMLSFRGIFLMFAVGYAISAAILLALKLVRRTEAYEALKFWLLSSEKDIRGGRKRKSKHLLEDAYSEDNEDLYFEESESKNVL